MKRPYQVGEYVDVGEPPAAELYLITGRVNDCYAKITKVSQLDFLSGVKNPKEHTVYVGRWFNIVKGSADYGLRQE